MKVVSTSPHHPLHPQRRTFAHHYGVQRVLAAFEGIEGAFAIGSGVMLALSFAHLSRTLLLMTAVVSIVVNGFNNACVKYMSEHYLDELDGREKHSKFNHYFIPAAIEFFFYCAISMLTVLPLLLVEDLILALSLNILSSLILLFLAGTLRGYMLRVPPIRDALETLLLGIGIIGMGGLSGYALAFLSSQSWV